MNQSHLTTMMDTTSHSVSFLDTTSVQSSSALTVVRMLDIVDFSQVSACATGIILARLHLAIVLHCDMFDPKYNKYCVNDMQRQFLTSKYDSFSFTFTQSMIKC